LRIELTTDGDFVSVALKPAGGNMKRTSLCLTVLTFLLAVSQWQESVYGGERAKYYTMLEGQVKDSAFVKYLRSRGIKVETDENGLLRIYVHGTPETIPSVVKFLGLMKTRMDVITQNLANVDTVAYWRKDFLIDKDGNAAVVNDETSPIVRYTPGHPGADEKGYVSFPNVDVFTESLKLLETSREYYLAERLLERCLPGNYIPDSIQIQDSIQRLKRNVEHFTGFREIVSNRQKGDLRATNNPLDLAIEGEGFFRILLPNGDIAYTRNGSMHLNRDYNIVTFEGNMLDPQIAIPQDQIGITIGSDGTVEVLQSGKSQRQQVGRIELARFQNPPSLKDIGHNLYMETLASGHAVMANPGEMGLGTILSGYLENSNVSALEEALQSWKNQSLTAILGE
jgi:flagellar basal body rod protein FlgG